MEEHEWEQGYEGNEADAERRQRSDPPSGLKRRRDGPDAW